jgi:site-specific recombinase XerD
MRHTGDDSHGWRLRAMIIVPRRAGLRVQDAVALTENDLDTRGDCCSSATAKAAAGERLGRTTGAGSSCARG